MNTKKLTTVKCPQCGEPVEWLPSSLFRPFCSKRCQLIDLGEWAEEEKFIPSAPDTSENEVWSEDKY